MAMTMSGEHQLAAPRQTVWQKLNDAEVLKACIPGCEELNKLSDTEFDLVKEHPVIGERILRPIIRNRVVLSAIRSHHERFGGGGYPDNLKGEEIPFLARMITVADCYDALTSTRAYRGALSQKDALDILQAGMTSQFDPHLVPPFIRMMYGGKKREKVR